MSGVDTPHPFTYTGATYTAMSEDAMAVNHPEGAGYAVERALLRERGQRVTPQRLQILQALRGAGRPLTVEELAAALQPQPIDQTTIYRVLHFLHELGLVAQLTPEQGRQRYKFRDPGDLHHHLICLRCGGDVQITDESFAQLRESLALNYRFSVQIDHLLIPGLCGACSP